MPPANKVEKMEVDEPKPAAEEKAVEPPKDLNAIAVERIKEQCALLDKGEAHIIHQLLNASYSSSQLHKEQLLAWVPAPDVKPDTLMDTTEAAKPARSPRPNRRPVVNSPETDLYLHLLTALYLFDAGQLDKSSQALINLIQRFDQLDRRSLDAIVAKAYFYYALIAEKTGTLDNLRDFLNSRLRTSTLRGYAESQAVLIYTLLRAYLVGRHYPSAAKLVTKVNFPEGASNNDLARFLYYQGRIKAMQLDYMAASGYFLQAFRKAPQDSAIGFKQNVQKWIIVVGLLQGDIPERSVFRQPIFRRCLAPYLELSQSVRIGDLAAFNAIIAKHGKSFEQDETLTLVVRLKQNVIRAAIKQIAAVYSRISIEDIQHKLQLSTATETEYMVAKAISDGGIDAQLLSNDGQSKRYLRSNEVADIYGTVEPQHQFDNRIRYCLELHNHAVKALRFPPKDNPDLETIEQQREREQQELEFAKEMAEEDDDDF
ncbi:unnamed protein product, partial [Mesorhabditis spiculigera]